MDCVNSLEIWGLAPVAQGIEHRFPKPVVAGSNPAGGNRSLGEDKSSDAPEKLTGAAPCETDVDGHEHEWQCQFGFDQRGFGKQ